MQTKAKDYFHFRVKANKSKNINALRIEHGRCLMATVRNSQCKFSAWGPVLSSALGTNLFPFAEHRGLKSMAKVRR